MSSSTSSTESPERTNWTDLTPGRQRVAKAVAHLNGPSEFERPDLRDEAEDSDTVAEVVDDKDRVLTSLDYTTLLNALEEEGYLVKTFQGGGNPVVVDIYYDEERDKVPAAPFGYHSKLMTLIHQVLDRNGLTDSVLNGVDISDWNAVIDAVNGAVSGAPIRISADASEYRFTQEGYNVAKSRAERAAADD